MPMRKLYFILAEDSLRTVWGGGEKIEGARIRGRRKIEVKGNDFMNTLSKENDKEGIQGCEKYQISTLELQQTSFKSYTAFSSRKKKVRLVAVRIRKADKKMFIDYLEKAADLAEHISGISRVTDYFEEDGIFYCVEEYDDGETLTEFAKKRVGRINDCDAEQVLKSLCGILIELHKEGFLVSWLHPSSVIILNQKKVKLIHIAAGFSKLLQERTLDLKHCIYEAPEQCVCNENAVSCAADIYRYSLLLYTVMLGEEPMPILQRSNDKVLQKLKSCLSEPQLLAVEKALSWRGEERQPSLTEFARELWGSDWSRCFEDCGSVNDAEVSEALEEPGGSFLSAFVYVCIVLAFVCSGASFLKTRADRMESQADQIDAQADQVESQADDIGAQADQVENQADYVEKQADHMETQSGAGNAEQGATEGPSQNETVPISEQLEDVLQIKDFFKAENYGEQPSDGTYGRANMEIPSASLYFLSGEQYQGLTAVNLKGAYTADFQHIQNINGVEYLSDSLEKLYLGSSSIMDITQLKELTKLKVLDLSNNKEIISYQPLKDLPALESLDLSDTRKTDEDNRAYIDRIKAVADIPSLKQLNISYTHLRDAAFLSRAKKLQVLNVSLNDLSDFSPLCGLSGLQCLIMNDNVPDCFDFLHELDLRMLNMDHIATLQDCDDIAHMKKMKQLSLEKCSDLSDISALKNLEELEVLNISHTSVTDLNAVSGLTELVNLNIQKLDLTDLSALSQLKKLMVLSMSAGRAKNLDALAALSNLKVLVLDGPLLSDLSGLSSHNLYILMADHTSLKTLKGLENSRDLWILNVVNSPVTDLSAIGECYELKEVDLSDTNVKDLSPLHDKTGIIHLYLNGIPASDFSFIKNFRYLTRLSLKDTSFSDISVLEKLSNLKKLELSGTKVTKKDIRILKKKLPECRIE